MEILGLLLTPIIFIAFIWLLVAGFKKSIPWGFGLLVGPLAIFILAVFVIKPTGIISILLISLAAYIPAILFAYKNWEEAKKPFLTYFISSLLSLLISINTLSNMGDNDLELLITQVQQGQLNEQDAAQRMRAIIERMEDGSSLTEQDKLVMQTAKTIIDQIEANLASDPDFYNQSVNQAYQQDLARLEAQRKREEALKKLEDKLKQRTTDENKPQPKKAITYPVIKKEEIKKYLKSKVIIVSIKDIKHRGILKDFDEETYSVVLEQEHKAGKLNFKIHMSDIKTVYLFIEE